ncbi:MAG: DUF924 family protein [Hyphomicrobium sp.]
MTTAAAMPRWVGEVLGFWFDELGRAAWFARDEAIDATCRERFSHLIDEINATPFDETVASPERALASVIVLDQFARNIFRGTARAFAYELARAIARLAIALHIDKRIIFPDRRIFLYLPFEHSEAYADQLRAVELIEELGDDEFTRYAKAHCDVVARFGRFPHRNAMLGAPVHAGRDGVSGRVRQLVLIFI